MRLFLLFLILLSAQVVLAQSIIDSDIDDEIGSEQFVLVVHPLQTTLYGPNLPTSSWVNSEMAGLSGLWESSPAWLIPGLVGMGVQISNFRDYEFSADTAVDKHAARFDYFGETMEALKTLSTVQGWAEEPIYDIEFSSSLDGGWRSDDDAEQVYRSTGAGNIAFLHFAFFISPDLLQVRIITDMKTYKAPRGKTARTAIVKKRLEYLGAPVDAACKMWKPGARAEVVQNIEQIYQEKMAAYPHNEKAYAKDRKLALKSIKDPTIMPPALVLANCWSNDSLHSALRLGISNVVDMLLADFGTPVADTPRAGEKISFESLNLKGKRQRLRGVVIYESGINIVVRLKGGDIYSVPKIPGSP